MFSSRVTATLLLIVALSCYAQSQSAGIINPGSNQIDGMAIRNPGKSQIGGGAITNSFSTPSGPIYTYVPAESGSCFSATSSCGVTVNTVNGDLASVNCINLSSTTSTGVSDSNGENWVDEADLSPNNGATGSSSVFVATIANGGVGDVVSCASVGFPSSTAIAATVDAFHSSTGWSNQDGTPTDQNTANYVLASLGGGCNVTAVGNTSQANELLYGACFSTAGTPGTTGGYTQAQSDTFTSIGKTLTGYQPSTIIQSPTFTTTGTLTNPQSLILTFQPN